MRQKFFREKFVFACWVQIRNDKEHLDFVDKGLHENCFFFVQMSQREDAGCHNGKVVFSVGHDDAAGGRLALDNCPVADVWVYVRLDFANFPMLDASSIYGLPNGTK